MYIHVHPCSSMSMSMCIHVHPCSSMSMSMYMSTGHGMSMYIHVHPCSSMSMSMSMHIHVHPCTSMFIHVHPCPCPCSSMSMSMSMYMDSEFEFQRWSPPAVTYLELNSPGSPRGGAPGALPSPSSPKLVTSLGDPPVGGDSPPQFAFCLAGAIPEGPSGSL